MPYLDELSPQDQELAKNQTVDTIYKVFEDFVERQDKLGWPPEEVPRESHAPLAGVKKPKLSLKELKRRQHERNEADRRKREELQKEAEFAALAKIAKEEKTND